MLKAQNHRVCLDLLRQFCGREMTTHSEIPSSFLTLPYQLRDRASECHFSTAKTYIFHTSVPKTYFDPLISKQVGMLKAQNHSICEGTREITRLDLTMQPLIQHIFSQIIVFCLYFPQRFSDSSCNNCTWKQNKNVFTCFQV